LKVVRIWNLGSCDSWNTGV